jgi:uncharacterized delta-60 repeat protein
VTGIVSNVGRLMGARRRLWTAVASAVTVAATAGAAPGGICPCPVPKPGQVLATPFPHHVSMSALAAVEQPDGRILVSGGFGASWTDYEQRSESALALARFRADGSADRTFGGGGSIRNDETLAGVRADGVGLDGAGRILAAGWDGEAPIVARFGPDGEHDSTFGTAGVVRGRREAPGADTRATLGLRVLADGAIVVVRVVRQPTMSSDPFPGGLSILRLRSDGSQLARTTRSAPEWTARGSHAYAAWSDAAIQADGSVVVAGNVSDPAPFSRPCPCEDHQMFVVRRFRANGSVDPSFGDRGRAMTKVGTDAYASDIAVAPDGTVVVVGASGAAGGSFAAARFLANGSLDRSFAAGGAFTLATGGNAERVALLPDGNVLLAGTPAVTVIRLDRNGRIDPAFGIGGRATRTGVGSAIGVFGSKDGGARVVTTSTDARIRLLHFTAAGQAEPQSDGDVTMAIRRRGAHAAVALRRGGVLLAGWIDTGSGIAPHLARTGSQSVSRFGSRGRVTLPLGPAAEATAVAEGSGGAVLAAGVVQTAGAVQWFAAKLGARGSLDRGFGTNGIAQPLAPAADAAVGAVVALPNGAWELLGRNDGRPMLVRLTRSGAPDSGFGDRGVVELPLEDAAGLAVTGDGRSIVGGSVHGSLAFVTVDRTGRPGAPVPAPVAGRAVGVGLERQGAIIVAGTSADGVVVARWRVDGAVDTTFGTNGVVTRPGYDAVDVGVQRDGRMVIAARDRAAGCLCLLRLLRSGRPDSSFGTDGVARAQPGAAPAAVAIGTDVLYAAGTAPTARGTDLALTTFHELPITQPNAVGIAVQRLSPTGAADVVVAGTHPAVSPNGQLMAYIGDDDGAPALFVADADGRHPRRLTTSPAEDGSVVASAAPVWSRDGRALAFQTLDESGNPQVSVIELEDGRPRSIVAGTRGTWGPGRLLSYSSGSGAHMLDLGSGEDRLLPAGATWAPRGDLLIMGSSIVRSDGTIVASVPRGLYHVSWKHDGTAVVGLRAGRIVTFDVRRRRARAVARVGTDARSPTWSRDGRWIAYVGKAGVYQLVVVDARTGRRVAVSNRGGGTFAGTDPAWGRAGVYVGIW